MKTGFACGVFDLFHAGHVLMLMECKKHCDYLVVAVNTAGNIDNTINPGKQGPVYALSERKLILEACKYVDEVVVYNSEDELLTLLSSRKFDLRFLGDDYRGRSITGENLNIPIHYTDRSHGLSTSEYRKKIKGSDQAK